jgi:transposase
MNYYIGCDAHKKYSVFTSISEEGEKTPATRVNHSREEFQAYLKTLPSGSAIAVETIGSWYWMVDEMEKAGHKPYLTHAGKAKKMAGQLNKTDKLDSQGLALLLKNGTLPSVWIPPGELRDKRELPRTRMVFSRMRTQFKNRLHATLAKYNIHIEEVSDLFGKKGRLLLEQSLNKLPPETKRTCQDELKFLDQLEKQLEEMEERIQQIVKDTEEMRLLMTLPGVGKILAIVMALEIGTVDRFPSAPHLASYAAAVPRIHSTGGRTYYGRVRPDVNRYLKWALIEAANVIVLHQDRLADRHVVKLYQRVRMKKGHPKAVVAVARHLAEASYWILKRNEPYKEPTKKENCFVHPRVSARLA